MARHRSPDGRHSDTALIRLDPQIPEPRTAESSLGDRSDTWLTGSLPRPRDAEPSPGESVDPDRGYPGPASVGADEVEAETVIVPGAAHRHRLRAPRKRRRRLPVGALTLVLVAGAVVVLIMGATTLLGARKSALSNPDQGSNLAQGLSAGPPAPAPAPAVPPAPAPAVPPAPPPPVAAPAPAPAQPPAREAKPEPAPKPQRSSGGAASDGPGGAKPAVPARSGSEKQLKIWLTGYSFQDNTPPGSATVSMPVVHKKAGGTGTYSDPITVAVPGHGSDGSEAWKGGTRFYLPTVQRYVIVEDSGASDPPSGQDGHLDMWVDGEGGSKSASDSCMDKITGTNVPAIMNPAPGKPVMVGPITENGRCNIPAGANKSDDD
jgi:hypothetical protein